MKKLVLIIVLISGYVFLNGMTFKQSDYTFDSGIHINSNYSKAGILDSILKNYAPSILPGASIAVYSETEGWWADAVGYANLEKKLPMNNNHLQYIQSVSKMFIAVEILQLKEAGRIELDVPMTRYLPSKYSAYITEAGKITVRMLLNHTSGIHEYNYDREFVSNVILHPLKNFSSEDCLKAIKGKPHQFEPGSKYQYTNVNYLILSLICDAITGDHTKFIRENIFTPLDMKNSYYEKNHSYLEGLNLPESYWDVLNVGIPVNITPFQKMTVACSKGDDGIVCTTTDAVKFLKGLMEGKLLKPESMKEMMNFVTDQKGNKRYGMGMVYYDLGGLPAYGHGGGGVGAGCGLVYIPSHKIYLFISTNLGVFVDGKLSKRADDLKNEVLLALL